MKIFLKKPYLYHFSGVVLKPGENEISDTLFEKMQRNKIVKKDFDLGILEKETEKKETFPKEEKPKVEKKTKKKKTKKTVSRDVEADFLDLENDDSN